MPENGDDHKRDDLDALPEKDNPEQSHIGANDKAPQAEKKAEPPISPAPPTPTPASPKETLEIDKLRLELRSLTYKNSFWGRLLDLVLAIGPIAAFLTLMWTINVGVRQNHQQRVDAQNARFDRAYTKLGSEVGSERISAVTQLSGLIHADGGARDQEVLNALINQLALDNNPAVTSAILGIFQHLDKSTSKQALDSALKNVIHMQQVLIQSSRLSRFEVSIAMRDERGEFFLPTELGRRSQQQDEIMQAVMENLQGLKEAFLALLRVGAATKDMGGIYCPDCDFKALPIDLSGVSFRGAILNRTQWGGLRLAGTDFTDSIIDGAMFWAADLRNANFQHSEFDQDRLRYVQLEAFAHSAPNAPVFQALHMSAGTPDFTCADLENANFAHYAVFVRSDDARPKGMKQNQYLLSWDKWSNFLRGADVSGAHFEDVAEIVLSQVRSATRASKLQRRVREIYSVNGPEGSTYRYVAQQRDLGYLKWNTITINRVHIDSEDGYRDRETLAYGLSKTRNYLKANLPNEVLPILRTISPNDLGQEGMCERWRSQLRTSKVQP